MKTPERARKLSALAKLLQGDSKPVEALRPPLTLDLEQFSVEELNALLRVSNAFHDGCDYSLEELAAFEQLVGGRNLRQIPSSYYEDQRHGKREAMDRERANYLAGLPSAYPELSSKDFFDSLRRTLKLTP